MSKHIRIPDIEDNQWDYMTNLEEIAIREIIYERDLEMRILRFQIEQQINYYDSDVDDEYWYSD